MNIRLLRIAALALLCRPFLMAQSTDDTQLRQVILLARHGVRTPSLSNSVMNIFSAEPYPVFPGLPGNPADNQTSVLTPNGATNETNLGAYFRLWLTREGLLTGEDAADVNSVFFRAFGTPLMIGTAQAFAAGMLPGAQVNINTYSPWANDPLFNPVAGGVAQLDTQMAVAAVNGRIGSDPQALASAFAPELAMTRSALFGYSVGQTAAPPTPTGRIDVTALPITAAPGNSTLPVDLGGLAKVASAIDPFIMEYADGLPDTQVGWGRLTVGDIGQIFRLYDLVLDLEFRTPYLAGVQSSNLASHIVRSMVQAATGLPRRGAVGSPKSTVVMLMGTNTNITGLAGLLHLDWMVPGYQRNVAAPGGILVFELRQSLATLDYIVRTSYVTQTMDQLRNRTTLTLDAPPASVPVFIPGCSVRNVTFNCALSDFVKVAAHAIDPKSVDLTN